MNETIPLSKPDIAESDIDAVVAVLRTSQLSLGPKLAEFEEAIAAYIDVPHAIAVSSGTAGLYLALQAIGIEEGDEVILPSFAFIAAANVILQCRAIPIFADIDPVTLNLTADSIARVIGPRTKAILIVHTFGVPADMDPILTLARDHGLRVIEDACEAIGAEYKGKKVGALGHLGVFSFYPNKPITTAEGGMVITRDFALARTIRALRNQGRMQTDGWLEHSMSGGNYRLSDINCALGVAQLSRVESILARREQLAHNYIEALKPIPEITPPQMNVAHGRISWFAYVIRLSTDRDRVIATLTQEGIGCRPYFPPIHLQPLCSAYRNSAHDLSVTEDVAFRTVALPFFNNLRDDQIERVCQVLKNAIKFPKRPRAD